MFYEEIHVLRNTPRPNFLAWESLRKKENNCSWSGPIIKDKLGKT